MQRLNFTFLARDTLGMYELEDDTWFTTPAPDYANPEMAPDPGLLASFAEPGTIYLQG